MPPRMILPRRALPLTTKPRLVVPFARPYSASATATAGGEPGPLIRTTLLPAPGSGHIRILELNRPQARNAISKALLAGLRAEIDDVRAQYGPKGEELPSSARRFGGQVADERGPTRALIVASAVDASFCAGADLKERQGFTPEE